MDKERKTFEFEIKELDDEGQFSGYLSTFGNIDQGGDVVDAGAFKKTLKENKGFPLTWAHSADHPDLIIGSFSGQEDERGLLINGEFFLDLDGGQKAYKTTKKLFSKKIKMGLSMGYKTMKYINETIENMLIRRLKEVQLKEGALTLFPMNEEARVESIKDENALETKPSKDNHTCRINNGDYSAYRSETRTHNGKPYTIRFGKRKDDGKMEEYEYFYSVKKWSAPEAKSHCADHEGSFEAASGKEALTITCSSCGETLKLEPEEVSTLLESYRKSIEPDDEFHSILEKIAGELTQILMEEKH